MTSSSGLANRQGLNGRIMNKVHSVCRCYLHPILLWSDPTCESHAANTRSDWISGRSSSFNPSGSWHHRHHNQSQLCLVVVVIYSFFVEFDKLCPPPHKVKLKRAEVDYNELEQWRWWKWYVSDNERIWDERRWVRFCPPTSFRTVTFLIYWMWLSEGLNGPRLSGGETRWSPFGVRPMSSKLPGWSQSQTQDVHHSSFIAVVHLFCLLLMDELPLQFMVYIQ